MRAEQPGGFANYRDWHRAALPPSDAAEYRTAGAAPLALIRAEQHATFPDAPTPDWVVQINLGGPVRVDYDLGHGRFGGTVPPGGFCVNPPDTPCDYESPHRGFSLLKVAIPFRLVGPVVERADGRVRADDLRRLYTRFHHDPLVGHVADRLWRETAAGSPWGDLLADRLADALIGLLVRLADPAGHRPARTAGRLSPARLGKVAEFVHAHLSGRITLADLAAAAHLSVHHFARQFKAATGLTPHEYVVAQRVERAKGLLREGRLPLARVAAEVGFADQSHLTRHFRRLVGVTPKHFG